MLSKLVLALCSALALLNAAVAQEAYLGTVMAWAPNFAPRGWMFCNGQTLPIAQYNALFALLGTTYGGNGQTTFQLPDLRFRTPVGPGFDQEGSNNQVLLGQTGGSANGFTFTPGLAGVAGSITVGEANLPAHSHTATFSGLTGTSSVNNLIPVLAAQGGPVPQANGILAQGSASGSGAANIYAAGTAAGNRVNLNGGSSTVTTTITGGTISVGSTGGSPPTPIGLNLPVTGRTPPGRSPYLGLNYIICVEGIFPPRD